MLSEEMIFLNTEWKTKGGGRLPLKIDAKARKLGQEKRLETFVLPTVNDECKMLSNSEGIEVKDDKHSALPVYLQK